MKIIRLTSGIRIAGILLTLMLGALLQGCGGGSSTPSYTVSTNAGTGGSITPASRTVSQNNTASLTVAPSPGYIFDSVSGCGGNLNGTTYTTGVITANCTVTASFHADLTGYYTNTGTIPDFSVSDLQAMIYNNRIIMLSKSQGLYYDGSVKVTGNNITSDGVISHTSNSVMNRYTGPGESDDDVILDATFNPTDHSISGTLDHKYTGAGVVSFTLVYASTQPTASVADIVNTASHLTWDGTLYSDTTDILSISLADNGSGAVSVTTVTPLVSNGDYANADFTGTLTPVASRFFEVNMQATGAVAASPLTFTGLAVLRGNTLVIAANYPTTVYGWFGEFQ